jgi:hypothetical protein
MTTVFASLTSTLSVLRGSDLGDKGQQRISGSDLMLNVRAIAAEQGLPTFMPGNLDERTPGHHPTDATITTSTVTA